MRLFNQTKNALAWSMGAASFSCEPWGSVDVSDELVPFVRDRGLPLGVAPIAPEQRAQQRIVDEKEAGKADALRALRSQLDDAQAAEKAAKGEIGRLQLELGTAREDLRKAAEAMAKMQSELSAARVDKSTAEELLTQENTRAADAETRALKAEAMLAEATRPAEPKRKAG